jgi:putative transposase
MSRACSAVGLSRATAYRRLRPVQRSLEPRARPRSKRRVSDVERARIIEVLDSERFIDQPPREVYAALLTAGIYLCSWSTMYRILRERGPVRERRNHREPKHHAIPRLVATAPNQVWTWDISKLATEVRGTFLNLYVVLDLFSRYVVAWMVAAHENTALAKQLFAEAISRYDVEPGQLLVHQDRGAPMKSHGFAELLGELGVERSYSRPRVSNDNPYSESHFHTVKYQPDYPGRFRDLGHARRWCDDFFRWYNCDHHHDGLALYTPADVFFGRVDAIAAQREAALLDAFKRHPERFVRGCPIVRRPPDRVLLNPADGEQPPTADQLLTTPADELENLWPQPPTPDVPVINIPGASSPPARNAQPQIAT